MHVNEPVPGIKCDGCGSFVGGFVKEAKPLAAATRAAEELGWEVSRFATDAFDLCETCVSQRSKLLRATR